MKDNNLGEIVFLSAAMAVLSSMGAVIGFMNDITSLAAVSVGFLILGIMSFFGIILGVSLDRIANEVKVK